MRILKKVIAVFLTLMMIFSFAASAEDAYMGFSVPDGWYVFSRDMEDKDLLRRLDTSKQEINKMLDNANCEYILANPQKNCEICVTVRSSELSDELFNLAEWGNEHIIENLRSIIVDGFSVKGFNYNEAGIVISDFPQMKFVTVPGSVFYDDRKHAILFGGTVVNGSAIGFTMHIDGDEVSDEDISIMQEMAQTVTFTRIKDRGEKSEQAQTEEKSQTALEFMVGGFVAIIVVVFCVYMIDRLKNKDDEEEVITTEETQEKVEEE